MDAVIEKPRQTIIGSVFETYNYEMFSYFEENRGVNPANVERIKKSMRERRIINPIIVDAQMRIVDGQHRYAACEELGISIQYIVDITATIEDIPRLNTITKTWAQKDFLEYYRKRGYEAYKTMYKFVFKHNININEALLYLSGDDGATCSKFKNGMLVIKDLERSNFLAYKMNEIKNINSKLGTRFYRTIIGITDKIDIDVLIHKMKIQPTKLVPCSNKEQMIHLLEEIYNYKSRKKVNLRF